MRKWIVVFQGMQREEIFAEGPLGPSMLAKFDKAARTGTLDGRAVTGMWIVDESIPPGDIIRIHGRVGRDMHSRHASRADREV